VRIYLRFAISVVPSSNKLIQNNNDLQQVITYNQTIIGKYAVLNFVNISNSIIGSYCQINSSTINNSTLMTSQSSPIIISEYSTLNACILHDNVQIGRYCRNRKRSCNNRYRDQ
jgi:ADP-glucose pyrophosphorylase